LKTEKEGIFGVKVKELVSRGERDKRHALLPEGKSN
jgi:hypothetical protein